MAPAWLYPALKLVHILSATLLLGNWLTLALWKASADRGGDARTIAAICDRVFRIDRQLTGPVALVAFASGYVIIRPLGMFGGRMALNGWAIWGLFLFFFAILVWYFLLRPMEARMADLADHAAEKGQNPSADYRRATVYWLTGIVLALAFGATAAALMVFKPALWPS